MVRVDLARWGQSVEDLRAASISAGHYRTRERFQALYLIASGQYNATSCAEHIGRQDETVLGWIHLYNDKGPDSLAYKKTGGRAPLFLPSRSSRPPGSSRTPSRPTTACQATSGPSRSSASTCANPSASTPAAAPSAER